MLEILGLGGNAGGFMYTGTVIVNKFSERRLANMTMK